MLAGIETPGVEATISASRADWSRERARVWWDPGRRLLRTLRAYQRWRSRRGPVARLVRAAIVIRHHFWQAVTGAEIPLTAQIGGGLLLPHPNGVVIHSRAVIGPNCLIFQQVTIGTRGDREGAPVIGGRVDIGAGAKILGPVRIGDHALIGANAVVIEDVPEGCIAAGVPARIVRERF